MSTTTNKATAKTYYVGLTGGRIFCVNCSPYRLYGSINAGRKNQKNFKGYDDETFSIMTEDEVTYMQKVLQSYMQNVLHSPSNVLESAQICECK